MLFHHVFEQMHWENLYYLLCAFSLNSFYFSTNALQLGKSLSFTMCFLILFSDEIDFLWKHDYELNPLLLGKSLPFTMCFPILFPGGRTGETSIIYYVLFHSIARFSLKTRMGPTLSYWGNPYHLLCASPSGSSYSPAGALPLGKPLLFTMCFPILFLDGLDFLWKHCYGLNPHLLGKPLPFTMCFPILFPGGRTGETPIIYYVLPHRVRRRAHCHWGNLYYLMGASSLDRVIGETSIIYYVLPHWIGLLGKPLSFTMCFPILFSGERLGTPLLFCMCFPIVFFGERIAIGETSTI